MRNEVFGGLLFSGGQSVDELLQVDGFLRVVVHDAVHSGEHVDLHA